MATLYLSRVRARGTYLCKVCGDPIPRRRVYWRHDPHPRARARGERTAHYCLACIPDRDSHIPGKLRKWGPAAAFIRQERAPRLVEPVAIQLYSAGPALTSALRADPSVLHELSPGQFEELVCDRLYAMGLEPRRVGGVNQRDGGIDVLFWPRQPGAFPFLGAAQVKHRRKPRRREGPGVVREFAGALTLHPIQVGILITNTSFTPSAEWFARQQTTPLRLRGFQDVRRWLSDSFDSDEEWREIPSSIEVCPGVEIEIGPSRRIPPEDDLVDGA